METVGRARFLLGCTLWLPVVVTAQQWPTHSLERPRPAVVDPGPERPPAPPPSDAIVLFAGQDLAEWTGGPWRVSGGYVEVVAGTGTLTTRRGFGDVQLHIEWASPAPPTGSGQDRGNSGVFLMGKYEIQVLDSYRSDTYPDGQAAALYGQAPPLVNACRPPGQWQTYDVVFRRPRVDSGGVVREPARVTVLHNGVLVHDAVPFVGPTAHGAPGVYAPHADRLPLALQDHGAPVRYRNIWIRELPDIP